MRQLAVITPIEGVPITGGHGSVALLAKTPHPNAAKLFINWLLDKEGQIAFGKAINNQSARLDLPMDFLPSDRVRQSGVNYWFQYTEDFLLGQGEAGRRTREVFGPLLR